MARVQRFERNAAGRDFVVGDLHGCFDQLEEALARARFDASSDRLFAVGDLIDRGPRSMAALAWMAKPWFHSCLGNHEWMRLLPLAEAGLAAWLLENGGEWWLALDQPVRERFLAAIARLPLAMEVETVAGRVGVVHADVTPSLAWPEFVAALEQDRPRPCEDAVWSRARAEGRWRDPVAGIERVVCGHTIMPDGRPHLVGNAWFIDTGAYLPAPFGRLTVISLNALFGRTAEAL